MFKLTTRQVTLAGVLGALMIVLQLLGAGFFPVTNLSVGMTIHHIPVIVGAIVGGPMVGILLGIIFAFLVMLQYGGMFPWFVLIPSRLFVGLFAFLAFYGMQKVLSNRKVKHWFIAITLTLIVAGILLVGISAFSVGSDTLVGVTEEVSGTVNRLQNNGFLFVGAFTLLSIVTSLQIMLNTEKLRTSIVVAAIVGTLTNTVLTLGVAVMTPGLLGDTIAQRLTTAWVIAGSNGAMEIILAIVLCLAIVPTLLNITKFTKAQIV